MVVPTRIACRNVRDFAESVTYPPSMYGREREIYQRVSLIAIADQIQARRKKISVRAYSENAHSRRYMLVQNDILDQSFHGEKRVFPSRFHGHTTLFYLTPANMNVNISFSAWRAHLPRIARIHMLASAVIIIGHRWRPTYALFFTPVQERTIR